MVDSDLMGKEGVQRSPNKRKPKSAQLLAQAQREVKKLYGSEKWDPVIYLMLVAADPTQEVSVRVLAAKGAAPYVHATLKAIELTGDEGGPVQVNVTGAKDRLAAMLLPDDDAGEEK